MPTDAERDPVAAPGEGERNEERVREIRERHEKARPFAATGTRGGVLHLPGGTGTDDVRRMWSDWETFQAQAFADVAWLLARIEELEQEVEHLAATQDKDWWRI